MSNCSPSRRAPEAKHLTGKNVVQFRDLTEPMRPQSLSHEDVALVLDLPLRFRQLEHEQSIAR